MDNAKGTEYYMKKIMTDIEFCVMHVSKIGYDEFLNNDVLNSAVCFKFVQISENVKKLPPSLLDEHPEIPWHKMSGLRNRIVHDYGSVQIDILYYTVIDDLPELLVMLKDILK